MKNFEIPGLEKANTKFSDVESMGGFFRQALINHADAEGIERLEIAYSNSEDSNIDPIVAGWYKNKDYDPEKRVEDDLSTHEYQWLEGSEDIERFEYIGDYYISKNEESTQMIIHNGKTEESIQNLNNGMLDMVMTSDSGGAFALKDVVFLKSNVFELNGGPVDFNYLTARLVDADIKFGTLMLVGHGTYDYSSERFMRMGSGKYTLNEAFFAGLKGTNFASSFAASSNLVFYQCSGARATELGLEQDKLAYQKLSETLGGASIFVSYGAVLPNPFVNDGNTTGNSASAKEYFKFNGVERTETIKKIINNNELWLKVQDSDAYHLYGFRLNLNNDQLVITTEESKEAVSSNFK